MPSFKKAADAIAEFKKGGYKHIAQSGEDRKFYVFKNSRFLKKDLHLCEYITENSPRRMYVDYEDYFPLGTFKDTNDAWEHIVEHDDRVMGVMFGLNHIFDELKKLAGEKHENKLFPVLGCNIRDYTKNGTLLQKLSIHIIFKGMKFANHEQMLAFVNQIKNSKLFKEHTKSTYEGEGFDFGVYSKNQGLRLMNQTKNKADTHSKMVIMSGEDQAEAGLVGLVVPPKGADDIVYPEIPINTRTTTRSMSPGSGRLDLLKGLLSLLPDDYCRDYKNWFKIGAICFTESNGSDEGCDIWAEKSRKTEAYASTPDSEYFNKWKQFKGGEITLGSLYSILSGLKVSKDAITEVVKANSRSRLTLGDEFYDMLLITNDDKISVCFQKNCKQTYRYSVHSGWWRLNDNNTWSNDGTAPHLIRTALLSTLNPMLKQALKELDPKNDVYLVKIVKQLQKSLGQNKIIKGVYEYLSELVYDEHLDDKMDSNPHYTAFTDCLYDCESHEFRPIQPDDYISFTCGYAFADYKTSTAVRSELISLLEGVLGGSLEYFLQTQSSALCATKYLSDFFIWTGSGGNGKGLINDFLMSVFGKNASPSPPGLFNKVLDSRNPELLKLRHKRYVSIPDSEPERDGVSQRLGGLVKMLEGDEILVRDNHARARDMVSMKATFVFNILCNDVPSVGNDGGIERRMKVIPFPFKFVDEPTLPHEKKKDPTLKIRLTMNEDYKKEFFILLTEKFQELKGNNFTLTLPDDVRDATSVVVEENNPVKTWFFEHYTITGNLTDKIKFDKIYEKYQSSFTQREQESKRKVSKIITDCGAFKKRFNIGVYMMGIVEKDIMTDPE